MSQSTRASRSFKKIVDANEHNNESGSEEGRMNCGYDEVYIFLVQRKQATKARQGREDQAC